MHGLQPMCFAYIKSQPGWLAMYRDRLGKYKWLTNMFYMRMNGQEFEMVRNLQISMVDPSNGWNSEMVHNQEG
jgi:hypothetical protein